jgi:Aromatic-ring-opening dioxygenase LigAB, LigA subunit
MSTTSSAVRLERFLARLYTDPALRAAFLADPRAVALAAHLSEEDADALVRIDRLGLELASDSFERKRTRRGHP